MYSNKDLTEEEQIALAIELSKEEGANDNQSNSITNNNNNINNNNNNSNYNSQTSVKRKIPFDLQDFAAQVKRGFINLFESKLGYDTVLIIAPTLLPIYCHSMVLATWSETFSQLLKNAKIEQLPPNPFDDNEEEQSLKKNRTDQAKAINNTKETESVTVGMELEDGPQVIEVAVEPNSKKRKMDDRDKLWGRILTIELHSEKEVDIFKLMIEYMYTGNISMNEEDIKLLLEIADRFTVIALKEACAQILGANVSESNLINLLEVVKRFDSQKLRKCIVNYLAKNFIQLGRCGVLLQLDLDTWKELAQSDDISVDSEEQVWDAVTNYASQFAKDRKMEILDSLVPFVRFATMDAGILASIDDNKEFKESAIFQQIMYETFRTKANPKLQTTIPTLPRTTIAKLLEYKKDKDQYDNYPNYNPFNKSRLTNIFR